MQKYEEMFLTDKDGLATLIERLTRASINNQIAAKEQLEEISKYIEYDVELEATFNYEAYCSYITGTSTFSNLKEFKEAKDNLGGWEHFDNITNQFNVCWDGEPSDGDITIDDDIEVGKVDVWGLNEENCCDEALKLEQVQREAAKIKGKQERIAKLQKELEDLKQVSEAIQ